MNASQSEVSMSSSQSIAKGNSVSCLYSQSGVISSPIIQPPTELPLFPPVPPTLGISSPLIQANQMTETQHIEASGKPVPLLLSSSVLQTQTSPIFFPTVPQTSPLTEQQQVSFKIYLFFQMKL